MKHRLLELAKQSTELVEKNNFRYYWEADGFKFNNRNLSNWYQKQFDSYTKFTFTDLNQIRYVLKDKRIDKEKNYNLEYLKHIRQKYDYLQFLISGGFDSNTIFLEAVENDIFLDETISYLWLDIKNKTNSEVVDNALPLIEKYKNKIGKHSFFTTTFSELDEIFSDDLVFFKRSDTNEMPLRAALTLQPGIHTPKSIERPVIENSCYIRCIDKPQLLYYQKNWYVFCLDGAFGSDISIPNCLHFWLEPENIKSLIKDAWSYRDYLIAQNKNLSDLQFFRFWDCSNELNYLLNRRPLLNEKAQFAKLDKEKIRFNDFIENNQWHLLTKYFNCMHTFYQIFPETKNSFNEYNSQGKFAWFINLETLEVLTQEELIPNGFE